MLLDADVEVEIQIVLFDRGGRGVSMGSLRDKVPGLNVEFVNGRLIVKRAVCIVHLNGPELAGSSEQNVHPVDQPIFADGRKRGEPHPVSVRQRDRIAKERRAKLIACDCGPSCVMQPHHQPSLRAGRLDA